ncbi:MAG: tRNA (adenosine(37)-N6)-threonylcarbamoyltransferase complex ATPase subunit type 1 TsaE [Candidatus Absconditabacterales bacterium]
MKISSTEAMVEFGKQLAKEYKILLLQGELGAGKTLLAKGFAKGLGLNENHVQSPTYAYLHTHGSKLLHIDMYRITEYSQLVEKGIIAQIQEYDHIVIEWPKHIEKLGLSSYAIVTIEKISETERDVTVSNEQGIMHNESFAGLK